MLSPAVRASQRGRVRLENQHGMLEPMRALELATAESKHITWQVAHETLSRLARERAAADAEEGRWLLAAQRSAVHVHLGYGAFSEYVCHEAWEGPMT